MMIVKKVAYKIDYIADGISKTKLVEAGSIEDAIFLIKEYTIGKYSKFRITGIQEYSNILRYY